MGSLLNAALYHEKNLAQVKTVVKSFVVSGISVTQPKVSLQTLFSFSTSQN